MIGRVILNAIAFGSVLTGKALIAARLRSMPAGWRQVMGIGLRGEPSKFAVSAFGLKISLNSDNPLDFSASIAKQLASFLHTEPEARYRLQHANWITTRHTTEHVDLVVQSFQADGTFVAIEPILAPTHPHLDELVRREKVHAAIVVAYNSTRHLAEDRRPTALFTCLRGMLVGEEEKYAFRLLGAACVSFETLPAGSERFSMPEFRARRCLGFGFLTFVVRPDPLNGTTDVWILAHHTGTDGMPLQELASRLERAWGSVSVVFPEPESPTPAPRPCFISGEREAFELTTFHDFSPLLALRKKLNARLAKDVGTDISFGCLFLWLLAQEPEFKGIKFASTVDVASTKVHERDVDLIVLRPVDFGKDEIGLVSYARAFNQLMGEARTRTSPGRKAVQNAALIPAGVYRKLLEGNPDGVSDVFGGVGLSVIRDANVFIAPLSDVGFPGGFIAIGGVCLPTASGRMVGAVSVKGNSMTTENYPVEIRRMLRRCRDM